MTPGLCWGWSGSKHILKASTVLACVSPHPHLTPMIQTQIEHPDLTLTPLMFYHHTLITVMPTRHLEGVGSGPLKTHLASHFDSPYHQQTPCLPHSHQLLFQMHRKTPGPCKTRFRSHEAYDPFAMNSEEIN